MRGKVIVAVLVVLLASAGRASAGAATWGGRYTVRAGDSLSAIAERYHVSLGRLADANRLDWRKTLLIGLVLRVPASGTDGGGTYIVRPGDTLSGIALRYHVSLGQIAKANAFDPAKVLLIGTQLHIPTSSAAPLDLAHLVERNPYRSGQVGFDISYPNCASGAAGYAVVCGHRAQRRASLHNKPVLRRRVGRRRAAPEHLHQHRLQPDPRPSRHTRLRGRRKREGVQALTAAGIRRRL